MSNLGQMLGALQLRIMQLEDALAEGMARQGSGKPLKVGKVGNRKRILDTLHAATKGLSQKEIEAALPGVKPMTIYMALREMRLCKPPLVETVGTGLNNDPYHYLIAEKFKGGVDKLSFR